MIKSYLILGSVIAALSALSIHSVKKNSELEVEIDRQIDISKRLSYLVTETQNSYERELTLREQLQGKLRIVSNETKAKIDNLNRELNDVRSNGDRLRDALRKANATNKTTAAPIRSTSTGRAEGVCSDMFDRISIRAEQYARRADELLISNQACIASYNHYQDYISNSQCAKIQKNTE